MKLLKKSERSLKTNRIIAALKSTGCAVREIGEYKKWKELSDGSQLSVTLTIYKVESFDGRVYYFFSDSLGRVASEMLPDLKEFKTFIKEHGYKTTHDFYIEDYGMTEETWKEWNEG